MLKIVEQSLRHKYPREYRIYKGMIYRCTEKTCHSYKAYGGAGVAVCDRWMEAFENFIKDMGSCPSVKHSLDRYPYKDGDYKPENCRWATRKEQSWNRKNVQLLTIDGVTKPLPEWCEIYGVPRKRVADRLKKGYTPKQALSSEIDPLRNRVHDTNFKKPIKKLKKYQYRFQAAKEVKVFVGFKRPDARLTATKDLGAHTKSSRSLHKVKWWLCDCDCGIKSVRVQEYLLKTGRVKSCGCLRREQLGKATTTHGECRGRKSSPERKAWAGMKSRCYNKKDKRYCDYGGRGIKVCDRWLLPRGVGVKNFVSYVGRKPSPKHSLERKDVNKNYEPGNVCWALGWKQANNKRTNRRFVIGGETKTLMEWCRQLGLEGHYQTIWNRITKLGWPPKRALKTPIGQGF